jgi:hypothetical protein
MHRFHNGMAELAEKVFELPQTFQEQCLIAGYAGECGILEFVFLNCRLEDATRVPTMRKPSDVLANALSASSSRGNWI